MRRNLLLINIIVMTATSLFLRTTGIMYRVFMSEEVSAEGMGLYTLTLSVFMFAVTFATSGISTAVTRLVSEELGRHTRKNITSIMRKAFAYAITVSLIAAFGMFIFSDIIGNIILNDRRTIILIKILTPALPCMAISSCIKGYFFALRQAPKPAIGEVVEQFAEMFVFFILIGILAPYGVEYACAAIVIGATCSEVFCCLYLSVLYIIDKRRLPIYRDNNTDYLKKLLTIAVPVAASACLNAGLKTVENILIPDGLRKNGATQERALGMYGMVRGMAIPVLFFPSAFLSAFSSLLIPELSEAAVNGSKRRIQYIISRVMQITLLLSILVTGIFMVFSNELGLIIYKSSEIGSIIQILAPLVILMYADTIVDGMLKGLDEQISVLRHNIIDSVIRIILILFLLPKYGFWGFMIVMYVSNIINPALSIWKLIRVSQIHVDVIKHVFKPILAVITSSLVTKCLIVIGGSNFYMTALGLSIGILSMCFAYFLLLLLFESLTSEDITWIYTTLKISVKKST